MVFSKSASSSSSPTRLCPLQLCVFDLKSDLSATCSRKRQVGIRGFKCAAVGSAAEATVGTKKKSGYEIETLTGGQQWKHDQIHGLPSPDFSPATYLHFPASSPLLSLFNHLSGLYSAQSLPHSFSPQSVPRSLVAPPAIAGHCSQRPPPAAQLPWFQSRSSSALSRPCSGFLVVAFFSFSHSRVLHSRRH